MYYCLNISIIFPGSKVTPILSWLQMGRDLFLIWFHYAIGAWKLIKKSD